MLASDYNTDFMVNAQGILLGNSTYNPLPFVNSQTEWIRLMQGNPSKNIAYTKSSNTYGAGLRLIATIQYTKTTD